MAGEKKFFNGENPDYKLKFEVNYFKLNDYNKSLRNVFVFCTFIIPINFM